MLMDPANLEIYRKRLLVQQQHIIKRLLNLEVDFHAVDDAERDIERMDRAQAEASEEVLERLDARSRREMADIQVALDRIAAGTYGICNRCSKTIDQARLDVFPRARHCIHCQKLAENTARESP